MRASLAIIWRNPWPFIPQEPPQLGRREAHEEFPTELTRLSLTWHIPEITHPDVPALDLLSTILGDGRSSRLYRRVREEAGLAFGVSAFSYTPGDPGLFESMRPRSRTSAAVQDLAHKSWTKSNKPASGSMVDEAKKSRSVITSAP